MPLRIQRMRDFVFVTGDGLASHAEAQQHFRDLSSLLVSEREASRDVRLMIDL